MKRTTVRLPESLYETLVRRAEAEGVSLNQYLTYVLTQVATVDSVVDQRKRFEALRSRLPPEEAEASLRSLLDARGA